MGERRMLSRKITDNDNFIELSAEQQALYMHLVMSADDEGACDKTSMAMFKAHANKSDLQALINAKYLLQLPSGLIIIKHWRMSNAVRKDRYQPTAYAEDFKSVYIKKNGSYSLNDNHLATIWQPSGNQMTTKCQPNDNHLATQVKLSKDKLSKDKLSKDKLSKGNNKRPAKNISTAEALDAIADLRNQSIEEAIYEIFPDDQSANF